MTDDLTAETWPGKGEVRTLPEPSLPPGEVNDLDTYDRIRAMPQVSARVAEATGRVDESHADRLRVVAVVELSRKDLASLNADARAILCGTAVADLREAALAVLLREAGL